MTINPIAFATDVKQQFLRYQLTAFPLSDPDLATQAREMLGGDEARELFKGPYVSLSRSFKEGASLASLVEQGRMHRFVASIAEHPKMFAHQERAFEVVERGHHCLVSTGTGSGKTESFLYPIIDHCYKMRDQGAKDGITAILMYPMNALAHDQLERLRQLLAGTGITFGMYVGSTPKDESEMIDVVRMKEGEGRDRIDHYLSENPNRNVSVIPHEERHTEEEIRDDPPRILITNINQMEFLLTRKGDMEMFIDAPLRFIVMDEAHTYTGARGAEVAVLMRRLRAFCGKGADEVTCIGTSATLSGHGGSMKPKEFAQRFFGVEGSMVELVQEEYEDVEWPRQRVSPDPMGPSSKDMFERAIRAMGEDDDGAAVSEVMRSVSKQIFDAGDDWRQSLFMALRTNDEVKAIHEVLSEPKSLGQATIEVWERLGRGDPSPDARYELMTYLVLGAIAEKGGIPLLRPQTHYFIRGMAGAVATLDWDDDKGTVARLHFNRERALARCPDLLPSGIFTVLSCPNCGQHYFRVTVEAMDGGPMKGGYAEGDNVYWPFIEDGEPIYFTNRFVSEEEPEEGVEVPTGNRDSKGEQGYICKYCGTLHSNTSKGCSNPACGREGGLVPVRVLSEIEPKTCPACKYKGRRQRGGQRTPFREFRAITVADVHILAQNMINSLHVDDRKLIVFADNRQDTAFQAAWMRDHARRYRLRHLTYGILSESDGPMSIGDLTDILTKRLRANMDLARTLVPEAFAGTIEEAYSTKVEKDMRRFLRINVLRELATSFKQRDSLENWGMMRVEYHGIDESDETIIDLSCRYGIPTDVLVDGISTLLDLYRRSRMLYDEGEPIYSRYWQNGDEEVQRGFIPLMDFPPKGLKFMREDGDQKRFVTGLFSSKGETGAMDLVKRWGIDPEVREDLLLDIWGAMVAKWDVMVPAPLSSNRGKRLSGTNGAYQIDSSKIGMVVQRERYRCGICGRIHTRPSPGSVCTRHRCKGRTSFEVPPEDDYNVNLLGKDFNMVRPGEHTAQVPNDIRAKLESQFKEDDGIVNCIVATPTLELGVDIGALDMVLMRNVPPCASNYWQRAGRAGRRHRMAVILTYCRRSVHDEYFFHDPMRLLSGSIEPPRFNLRNPVMIEKHAHATVLSELRRIEVENGPDASSEIDETFPLFISGYLVSDDGTYEGSPPSMQTLGDLIGKNRERLIERVGSVFSGAWPEEDSSEVENGLLEGYVDNMPKRLQSTVDMLHGRMMWAINKRNELNRKMEGRLELDEMDRKLLQRSKSYLKGLRDRRLETYTLNVLATEGFLPGYATSQGSVTGFAMNTYAPSWKHLSFEVTRPSLIAVREFVPGNLIYANGGRYKVALYHLPFTEERVVPDTYLINTTDGWAIEEGKKADGYLEDDVVTFPGIQISDVDLGFMSHVSDEEQFRFRMSAALMGILRRDHRGRENYKVGDRSLSFVHGQGLRVLNAGPQEMVSKGEVGYPLCRVCGAVRSPFASERELENFREFHKKKCGQEPTNHVLAADSKVDGLLFEGIEDMETAINMVEGIRLGASLCLEMDQSDIQVLPMRDDTETFHVLLYDPMPGGSGIIGQIVDRWPEVIRSAIAKMEGCENKCERSCYSCLRNYGNVFYHDALDRKAACDILGEMTAVPVFKESLPPVGGEGAVTGGSTNIAEMRLARELERRGFPPFREQVALSVNTLNFMTYPDFYYESDNGRVRVAIYLDGLSRGIHGNDEQKRKDEFIRQALQADGAGVVSIPATALDDPVMLDHYMALIAKYLSNGS